MSYEIGSLLKRSEMSKYGLSFHQHRVLSALSRCRTGELGSATMKCGKCGIEHVFNCSCGNRHCPTCQGDKTLLWSMQMESKLLPCEYFLMTFTIPESLRSLVYKLQDRAYGLMLRASASVIREMMSRDKNLGVGQIGFSSILHTWGGQLQFHPHVHVLLPGGGVDHEGGWRSFRPGFALPVRAASKIWMGKLLAGLEEIAGRRSLPQNISDHGFHVHCQTAGSGLESLRYLSRYVFRVAIDNRRIKKVEGEQVLFSYRKKDTRRSRHMRLHVDEFIRRFSSHILPRGFVKVRHYGFHHPNTRIDLVDLRLKITRFHQSLKGLIPKAPLDPENVNAVSSKPKPKCRRCGSPLPPIRMNRKTIQPDSLINSS